MKKLRYKWHFKKNILLAYPVMLSQLGHVLVGLADSVMVGQVGTIPLAAAAFANAIFYFPLTFGIGISYGITPHVAEADGQNDTSATTEYLKHGFLIDMLLGLFLFGLVYWLTGQLVHFDQPEDVYQMAVPYLLVLASSIIPLMLFQTFRQFAEGLSLTKVVMVTSVGSNILNVLLNYILIFGKFGFEPMGLLGAGYATLISRIVMGLWMAGYVVFGSRFRSYWSNFRWYVFESDKVKDILKIGLPAGLQFIFEVGAFGFAAIMVGWIGAAPLAAHQIAINLSSLSYMSASGLAAAATIRVGNQLGKKDLRNLREAGYTSFAMVILLMSITGLIFFVGRRFLPGLYVEDIEVIGIASSLMIVAALFQISDGVQVVGLGALRGMKDVKVPTLYTLLAYWIIGLPGGYFFAFTLEQGAIGIWYGLLLGLTISAVLNSVRFRNLTRDLPIELKV